MLRISHWGTRVCNGVPHLQQRPLEPQLSGYHLEEEWQQLERNESEPCQEQQQVEPYFKGAQTAILSPLKFPTAQYQIRFDKFLCHFTASSPHDWLSWKHNNVALDGEIVVVIDRDTPSNK